MHEWVIGVGACVLVAIAAWVLDIFKDPFFFNSRLIQYSL